ncbi:L,D-transpeptidase family protein [Mucilaginibacter calamicampi]|uniref:L,D-transpeptidase family protein n=1 Tax=Mucilaginibacter calamicampi TaxID=1302352 RepID=A0ABW2Z1C6_9SPHI
MKKYIAILFLGTGLLAACNEPQEKKEVTEKQETKKDTVTVERQTPTQTALTLPILDALFFEKDFSASLKSQLNLTAAQIAKLKSAAHASVEDLTEDGSTNSGSLRTATQQYEERINEIIGADKAQQLLSLINSRYSQGLDGLAPTQPNFVPKDTRIVVNAPAFRMDVFQDGKLLKSYKVGIGYPEFPLPTGMRRADTIIFRPSWIPPDEPWVRGKFAPGRKVSGADEDNPLGVIKIPIGLPSLIHGGKPEEKIGNFASHGCVGLMNSQVKDFAPLLIRIGGAQESETEIAALIKQTKTKSIRLTNPVPVDLRYETIVAQGDSLHIYRDVYERGTNTPENAKAVLAVYGINYEQLNTQEKAGLDAALNEMNTDPKGNPIAENGEGGKDGVAASKIARSKQGKVTSKIKGDKERVVAIAALGGKGYPAPIMNK